MTAVQVGTSACSGTNETIRTLSGTWPSFSWTLSGIVATSSMSTSDNSSNRSLRSTMSPLDSAMLMPMVSATRGFSGGVRSQAGSTAGPP